MLGFFTENFLDIFDKLSVFIDKIDKIHQFLHQD